MLCSSCMRGEVWLMRRFKTNGCRLLQRVTGKRLASLTVTRYTSHITRHHRDVLRMIALAPKVAGVEAEADAALKKQQGNQTKPMAEAVQALDWCVKHRTLYVTRHTSHVTQVHLQWRHRRCPCNQQRAGTKVRGLHTHAPKPQTLNQTTRPGL